jgi:hypothetical protein
MQRAARFAAFVSGCCGLALVSFRTFLRDTSFAKVLFLDTRSSWVYVCSLFEMNLVYSFETVHSVSIAQFYDDSADISMTAWTAGLNSCHFNVSPTTISAMRLTTLPAEIRNEIYSFVLSTHSPLIYWVDPVGVSRICARHSRARARLTYQFSLHGSGSALDFNQLKYVSRMLYKETRGLERCYNEVSAVASRSSRRLE